MPKPFPRQLGTRLRILYRRASLLQKATAFVALLLLLESIVHVRQYEVPRPAGPLDAPFYTGCQDPVLNNTARASAVLVMLARNSEIDGAIGSVRSVQEQFNDNFGYPWVFLNDVPFSAEFKERVGQEVGDGAEVKFEHIPKGMWGFPEWMDEDRAKSDIKAMARSRNVKYGASESYHHMCRFQSGFFFDHPALLPYRYYWRVEPNIRFTCALTYDPFVAMQTHKKRYGYNIALWERGETVPSLFRKLSDFKLQYGIPTTPLWTAMIDPSYMPWPFRRLLALLRNRDANGDLWNMCHFWSNFEIADLEFYRSRPYRKLFEYLDKDGGFYNERWGDAAVHSLAAAMLLEPEELHHFSDLGYIHDGLQYCAFQSTPAEKQMGYSVPPDISGKGIGKVDGREEVGCRCRCDPNAKVIEPICMNRIGLALA